MTLEITSRIGRHLTGGPITWLTTVTTARRPAPAGLVESPADRCAEDPILDAPLLHAVRRSSSSPAIASRRLTGERDGGGLGSVRSIASGSGSAAEATSAGLTAKLGGLAARLGRGDVTAGGEDCN